MGDGSLGPLYSTWHCGSRFSFEAILNQAADEFGERLDVLLTLADSSARM